MSRKSGSVDHKIPSLLLISAFVIAGCGSDSPSEPTADTPVIPAGTDTGNVSGTDAGAEASTDAETETGTNAENVTGTDAGNVTGTEADADGETESATSDEGTIGEGTLSPTTVGEANCAALQASGNTASIAGLYNLTMTNDSGQEDVGYLAIANNGALTTYDYQQDDADEGENCYIISTGISVLSPLGNDEFVSTHYIDEDENCETATIQATIIRTESKITSTYIDVDDDDDDGNTTELISDVLPVVAGVTVESFNRCD